MKHGYILLGFTLLCVLGSLLAGCSKDAEGKGQRKAETITLWTTEYQPERVQVQEDITAKFKARTGITVTVVPIDENLLSGRVTEAFVSGELPDMILSP